eukprot:GHVS01095262.1.p1 GENE.GHVS01095262.1~~GHVS01095262.1.p1  ORF type:complete len:950 (+),score=201.49 GHVS01095262.1:219-2852(+)
MFLPTTIIVAAAVTTTTSLLTSPSSPHRASPPLHPPSAPTAAGWSSQAVGSTGKYIYGSFWFWVNLCLCVVLVLVSGVASGLTTGLMSFDTITLRVLQETGTPDEQTRASRVYALVKRHHLLLVTLLLTNSIAMEALPVFLDRLVPTWLAVILSVTCILFFGEVLPQAICTGPNQLTIAAFMVPFVYVLMFVMFVLAWPVSKILDKLLGREEEDIYYARSHLKALIGLHQKERRQPRNALRAPSNTRGRDIDDTVSDVSSGLGADEVVVIQGALDMAQKSLAEIMVPLDEIYMLEHKDLLTPERMRDILDAGRSRIPVYAGNRHNIRGLLLVKSLITVDPSDGVPVSDMIKNADVRRLCSPIFTSPDCNPYDLLNQFQEGRSHMAIVTSHVEAYQTAWRDNVNVDEHARVYGLVTLEDVIEELIQEDIWDEFDCDGPIQRRLRFMSAAHGGCISASSSVLHHSMNGSPPSMSARLAASSVWPLHPQQQPFYSSATTPLISPTEGGISSPPSSPNRYGAGSLWKIFQRSPAEPSSLQKQEQHQPPPPPHPYVAHHHHHTHPILGRRSAPASVGGVRNLGHGHSHQRHLVVVAGSHHHFSAHSRHQLHLRPHRSTTGARGESSVLRASTHDSNPLGVCVGGDLEEGAKVARQYHQHRRWRTSHKHWMNTPVPRGRVKEYGDEGRRRSLPWVMSLSPQRGGRRETGGAVGEDEDVEEVDVSLRAMRERKREMVFGCLPQQTKSDGVRESLLLEQGDMAVVGGCKAGGNILLVEVGRRRARERREILDKLMQRTDTEDVMAEKGRTSGRGRKECAETTEKAGTTEQPNGIDRRSSSCYSSRRGCKRYVLRTTEPHNVGEGKLRAGHSSSGVEEVIRGGWEH